MSDRVGDKNFEIHDYGYYIAMKADLTKDDNDGMAFAIDAYRNHSDDEDIFQLCIGSYVCGNAAVRKVMEEEFRDEKKFVAMKLAKDLVQKNEIEQNTEVLGEENDLKTKERVMDSLKEAETNDGNSFMGREIRRREESRTL